MEYQTLPAQLAHWARECPERTWLRDLREEGSEDYSWGEAQRQVQAVAAVLEERFGSGNLQRCGHAENQKLVGRPHCLGEMWCGDGPADLPSCQREGLADRRGDDGSVSQPSSPHETVMGRIKVEVLIHLITEDDQVMLYCQRFNDIDFIIIENPSRWIVRRIDNEHPCLWSDCRFKTFTIDSEVRGFKPDISASCAGKFDCCRIAVVPGLKENDFVVFLEDAQHGCGDCACTPGRDGDLMIGIDVHTVVEFESTGHGLAHDGQAGHR